MVKAYFLLILVTFIWGSTFPLVKMNVGSNDVYIFLTMRFAIASLLSFLIWKKQSFKHGVIIGIFIALGFITQTIGLTLTTASKSGFITSLYIIMVPFFSYLIEKEKAHMNHIIALPLAAIGSYLLSGGISGFNLGDFLTVICAIAFALSMVYITKYSKVEKETSLLGYQFLIVAVLNGILSFTKPIHITWSMFGTAMFTALFATIFATLIQLKYQKVVSTNTTAFIFVGEPIFAMLSAYIFLGERMNTQQIIGALILLSALIIASVKFGIKEVREI
ncbi:EamA-like transporter family protein [Marinitoga hydrogenitolerans DSM 16785]|uniref:EamA-like transporter family protein n=1 Tax=Marinitoga hydrogenitolerans (strain DSM 16785 / JCM 12826 / AT1271) TaxID=1122195 RepID=A0A1M4SXE4_MARH1|nr:DMT family transporter [Marinitoga hydrogenitolerans]SHE36872.1 EamA-like transporter family protein [Marinitoga hydrogenitolerans DSM 16785]